MNEEKKEQKDKDKDAKVSKNKLFQVEKKDKPNDDNKMDIV